MVKELGSLLREVDPKLLTLAFRLKTGAECFYPLPLNPDKTLTGEDTLDRPSPRGHGVQEGDL